jgi:RNA polymerase sigma-70 factor (ECF subfamily)
MILKLMYEDGLTAAETAKRMGMGLSAVKVAAHRAYKVLRKKLAAA